MVGVVNEMKHSFENDEWELEMKDYPEYSVDVGYILTLQHPTRDLTFIITEAPLHFHIDVEISFDVLVNNEREQLFSLSQKEMLYKALCNNFNVMEFIAKYAQDNDITLHPFKTDTQKFVYDTFIDSDDKKRKYR